MNAAPVVGVSYLVVFPGSEAAMFEGQIPLIGVATELCRLIGTENGTATGGRPVAASTNPVKFWDWLKKKRNLYRDSELLTE